MSALTMVLSAFQERVGTKNADPLHSTSMSFMPNSGTHIHVVKDIDNFFFAMFVDLLRTRELL